jgi:uncharacterized lipoprotein YddW (UPF0748 family)
MRQAVLVIGCLLCCLNAQAENLLQNGSFEQRDANRQFPAFWTETHHESTPLQFTGEHHHGATSGVMIGDGKSHLWRQNVAAPKEKAFTLSAFVKASGMTLAQRDDYAFLYGHILYKNQPYESATHFYVSIPPGSYDWKKISVTGGSRPDLEVDSIQISVTCRFSSGKVMVDEVSLSPNEELSPETCLLNKIEDLQSQLKRIGPVDDSVTKASAALDSAKSLLTVKKDLAAAKEQWIVAARAVSPAAWAKMYPEAMTDKKVEAQMLYHGIAQTEEDTDKYLDLVKSMGCNGVYHSLGSWMTAIYPSEFIPTEPGWDKRDALKYAVAAAKKRGIKTFGYIAAAYGTSEPPTGPESLFTKHPDWFAKGPDASMPRFPDPANLEYIDYLVKVYVELATKYEMDGIGLDYIRYPTETALNYDENNRKQIQQKYGFDILEGGMDVSRDPVKWSKIREYRGEKVREAIRRIHDAVKAAKPSITIMACLISEPELAPEYGQNWSVSSKWIDYASPMNYDDRSADYKMLSAQKAAFEKNHARFIPALGGMPETHEQWTISKWAERVALNRKIGCDGLIIYRMGGLDPAVAAFFGNGPFHGDTEFPAAPTKQ